jgi:hypothetical protein
VTLQEFRRIVAREFGPELRRMTPANVRDFLDRVQPQVDGSDMLVERIFLNEPQQTYEGIVRDFLLQALEMPSDQAVIRLWLYCLELIMAGVTDLEEERFQRLFAQLTAADGEV